MAAQQAVRALLVLVSLAVTAAWVVVAVGSVLPRSAQVAAPTTVVAEGAMAATLLDLVARAARASTAVAEVAEARTASAGAQGGHLSSVVMVVLELLIPTTVPLALSQEAVVAELRMATVVLVEMAWLSSRPSRV